VSRLALSEGCDDLRVVYRSAAKTSLRSIAAAGSMQLRWPPRRLYRTAHPLWLMYDRYKSVRTLLTASKQQQRATAPRRDQKNSKCICLAAAGRWREPLHALPRALQPYCCMCGTATSSSSTYSCIHTVPLVCSCKDGHHRGCRQMASTVQRRLTAHTHHHNIFQVLLSDKPKYESSAISVASTSKPPLHES
jgi:hypothetical protein